MADLLLLTSVLVLFTILNWPSVFCIARDLRLDGDHPYVYSTELQMKRRLMDKVTNHRSHGNNNRKRFRIGLMTVAIPANSSHFITEESLMSYDNVMGNLANKFKYAYHHGYEFIPVLANPKDPDLPAAWAKIVALQRYLPKYDWIWCSDLDLYVTNRHLSIEEHVLKQVPPDKSIVLAKDCNHLNTGSFFIRNSPDALRFLNAVYSHSRNTALPSYDIWYEQSAVVHLFDQNIDNFTSIFHFVPQQLINSYGHINCGHQWQLGDFAVHFPGKFAKEKLWQGMITDGGPALQALLP